jgi:glycosyltransferase involved in cell wall biosynthesis
MRIAYDTTPMFVSRAGVARYARALLASLECTLDEPPVEISCMEEQPASLPQRIRAGVNREGIYYPIGLARRARAASADVIHCPGAFPAAGRGLPTVLTLHDALPWRYPELFTRVNALHQRGLVGRAARRASVVLTSSEHSKRELMELLGVDEDAVVVTPLGVAKPFGVGPADPERIAARFGLDGPYILAVGTVEPRKNLERTLGAFIQLRREFPEHQLMVAGGSGWGTSDLETRLAAAAGVVRTGHVTDEELAGLYRGCEVFVYPSLYEGFGLPPLEAMACGAPVVAANSTSLPEVVGNAAILIDPRSTEELADALRQVLESPSLAEDLSRRGLDRAAAFTWGNCAEQTAQAYALAAARAAND